MKRFLAALAVLMFVSACGQSGPLYIPGNPSRIEQPPPAAEEPAEEESADENGDNED